MRLTLAYDPEQRSEAQHHLRTIPPSERVNHPNLKAALAAYEEARTAEHEARLTHVQLVQELPAAEYKDELALADAREKGKPDPGATNAERHQKAIAEAKRDWGARKIALQRAVAGVTAAFEQDGDGFEANLETERDALRERMQAVLGEWAELWQRLQVNTANRALGSGSPKDPSVFVSSFKVPMVRDGSVIQVADVLEGLRDLAKPEPERDDLVENVPVGHTPPSRQPFAGRGSQGVALGPQSDPETVRAWQERDEAEARQRAAGLSNERRQERMARAGERRAEREMQNEIDREAVESVR